MSNLNKAGTYGELWAIYMDIQNWRQRSPAFAHFFAHKIKEFMSQNRVRLDIVIKKQNALVAEYVQHESVDGKLQPMVVVEDNIKQYKFENAELKDKYLEEVKNIMATQIMITA